jgi:hypothetical protein
MRHGRRLQLRIAMSETVDFLFRHGEAFIFLYVLRSVAVGALMFAFLVTLGAGPFALYERRRQ